MAHGYGSSLGPLYEDEDESSFHGFLSNDPYAPASVFVTHEMSVSGSVSVPIDVECGISTLPSSGQFSSGAVNNLPIYTTSGGSGPAISTPGRVGPQVAMFPTPVTTPVYASGAPPPVRPRTHFLAAVLGEDGKLPDLGQKIPMFNCPTPAINEPFIDIRFWLSLLDTETLNWADHAKITLAKRNLGHIPFMQLRQNQKLRDIKDWESFKKLLSEEFSVERKDIIDYLNQYRPKKLEKESLMCFYFRILNDIEAISYGVLNTPADREPYARTMLMAEVPTHMVPFFDKKKPLKDCVQVVSDALDIEKQRFAAYLNSQKLPSMTSLPRPPLSFLLRIS